MKLTINIYGHEYTTRDGRKFVKYVTKSKDGVYYDVAFTRSCLVKPSEAKNYTVTFNSTDSFIKPNDVYNDTLFIKKVITIDELVFTHEDKVVGLF